MRVTRAALATALFATIVVSSAVVAGTTVVSTATAQEATTVTADAELSDAPGEETMVMFELVEADTGTVVDQTTAAVGSNETETGEVTLTADFENEALDEGDTLTVEAEAIDGNSNYETDSAQVTDDVQGGESYDATGQLGLDAEPVTLTADTGLSDAPGETRNVTFLFVHQDTGEIFDETTATIGPDETNTGPVTLTGDFLSTNLTAGDFTAVSALIEPDSGYEDTPKDDFFEDMRPGDELDATGELLFEAEPATVNVDAELEVAPDEERTVTFELVEEGNGTVVDTATVEVSAGETLTDNATLAADFADESVDSGDEMTVVASAEGYDDGSVTATDAVRPGSEIDVTEEVVLNDSQSVAEYANGEGVVETTGLRDAISDWRGGGLDIGMLRDVVDAWRTGEPVG